MRYIFARTKFERAFHEQVPEAQRTIGRNLLDTAKLLPTTTMIQPRKFEPSDIEFQAAIYELGDEGDELEAVVLQFSGTYGYGSNGNGDAKYMVAIRDYILDCVLPCAIVFDLRELDYKWGNTIWGIFLCDTLPFATVVSRKCSGFQTCGVAEPMFESLESALNHLRPQAKMYQNSLLE